MEIRSRASSTGGICATPLEAEVAPQQTFSCGPLTPISILTNSRADFTAGLGGETYYPHWHLWRHTSINLQMNYRRHTSPTMFHTRTRITGSSPLPKKTSLILSMSSKFVGISDVFAHAAYMRHSCFFPPFVNSSYGRLVALPRHSTPLSAQLPE